MAHSCAPLIDLFVPLLLHDDPQVQRQSAVLLYSSYGDEAVQRLRTLMAQGDARERQRARLAHEVLARHVSRATAGPLPGLAVQVACLGVLRVWVAGVPILAEVAERDRGRAGSHKLRAVLAGLIHAGGRGISREALMAAVWGQGAAAHGLMRTLGSLRALIVEAGGEELADAVLLVDEDRCLLHPDHVQSDAAIFERLCVLAAELEQQEGLAAAAPLYAQALELYRGPYMADVSGAWSALIERRNLLAGDFLNLVERLAAHAFNERRYHECARLCDLALAEDPAADDLTVWLLRAYAGLGHYAELEHAFQHYLRAARVDPRAGNDPVVRVYARLRQERAVGL